MSTMRKFTVRLPEAEAGVIDRLANPATKQGRLLRTLLQEMIRSPDLLRYLRFRADVVNRGLNWQSFLVEAARKGVKPWTLVETPVTPPPAGPPPIDENWDLLDALDLPHPTFGGFVSFDMDCS